MKSWGSLQSAFRGLRANALRSLLTMLGIIIGVAAVITMVAVGAGAHQRVAEQIRSLGANLLMVVPGAAKEDGRRLKSGTRHTLTEADAAAIRREIPVVTGAAPSVRSAVQLVHSNQNWNAIVNGTTPEYFEIRDWPVASGRTFTRQEVSTAAKVALIGETVAKELFEDADAVGQLMRIGDVPFNVVGVLSGKGTSGAGRDQDDIVFVPISTAKLRLFGSAHEINREAVAYVLAQVASEDAIATAEGEIRKLLRQRHRRGDDDPDDFQVHNPVAVMATQQAATRTLTYLLAAVALVSLVVGGISIMNIMLVSVTERTREIGLRMAVGARQRDIRNQFLVEAVTLCLLGGVIGSVVGTLAAIAVAQLTGWAIFIEPQAVALAVGFAAAVGVFFGYYPALKASRLDPIEALRFE